VEHTNIHVEYTNIYRCMIQQYRGREAGREGGRERGRREGGEREGTDIVSPSCSTRHRKDCNDSTGGSSRTTVVAVCVWCVCCVCCVCVCVNE